MKRYIREWITWCAIAEIYDFNPHEECEIGFDEGGGDTIDFEYIGKYPKDFLQKFSDELGGASDE